MTLTEAQRILSDNNIPTKELYMSHLYLSSIKPKNLDSINFALDDNAYLYLDYNKETKRITSLSVMFVPSHRPLKGLEIHKELEMIGFHKDGYMLIIKKPNKANAADANSRAAD